MPCLTVWGAPGLPWPEPSSTGRGTALLMQPGEVLDPSDPAGGLLSAGTQAFHAAARGTCRRATARGTSRRASWASGRFLRSRNGHARIAHHTLQYSPAPPPFCLCAKQPPPTSDVFVERGPDAVNLGTASASLGMLKTAGWSIPPVAREAFSSCGCCVLAWLCVGLQQRLSRLQVSQGFFVCRLPD